MRASAAALDAALEALARAAGASDAACAADVADERGAPFADEDALVARAVAARRRHFAAGRRALHAALEKLGAPAGPILRDADGVPLVPAGFSGSLSHAGERAVAIAFAGERAAGVDLEDASALGDDVAELVVGAGEHACTECAPHGFAAKALFCVKESVYKCVFPITRARFDFPDVDVDIAFAPFLDGVIVPFVAQVQTDCSRHRGAAVLIDDAVLALTLAR